LTLAVVAGVGFWLSSATFEELVRERLVHELEESTGGRVEIGSFHWHLTGLEAEAAGVVIHGLEGPGEAPYVQVERLRAGVNVLGFWSPRILLRDLEVTQPAIHLIVYPDGSTNQPRPRKPGKPGRPLLDTVFDLQAGHVAVTAGVLDFDDRAAAFDFQNRRTLLDFDARDVSLRMAYVAAAAGNAETYRIEAGATDLSLLRGRRGAPGQHGGKVEPVQGYVQATLDLARSAAYLRSMRVSSRGDGGDHSVVVSGALEDFSHPRWHASVTGDLDMRLIEPATGYPDAPEGIAKLNLTAVGGSGQFRIDGEVHATGASYLGPGVVAKGIQLDAHVHADPEQLLITSIVARLRQGGQIEGVVALANWLPAIPGEAVVGRPGMNAVRAAGSAIPTGPIGPDVITIPVNGKVTANFKGVSLDTILDIVGSPPFQRLGLDARLNGPAIATWVKGDQATLAVDAKLGLTAPATAVIGEAPTSGMIDAVYTQRDGAVDVRSLELNMPSSQVEAHGHLGAYPLTSATNLTVDLHSRNLDEFDTVLRDLGLVRDGRAGTAALPVTLSGEADIVHAQWTGSLLDPHLAGELKATGLAVELPPRPGDKSGRPQFVQWDTVAASGSYSAARIAVDHGLLRRGKTEIEIDGTLGGHPGAPPELAFDGNSLLHLKLHASRLDVSEWMPFTGRNLPLTGMLEAQIAADGPIDAVSSSGWVELNGGTVWGEPVDRIRLEGSFADPTLRLTSLTASQAGGDLSASGHINLKTGEFQVDTRGASIDLAKIENIRHSGLQIAGKVGYQVHGSGTLDDPRLEGSASLTALNVEGESLGGMELTAHTENRTVIYGGTTHLETAALKLSGETTLHGDFGTRASLEFSQFDIGPLLTLAHVAGLSGESALAGTLSVEGPLARPQEMHGDARLRELAATIAGVHLKSEGGVHATLANSRINLDPLHVTGEETDLHAQGSLALKDRRQLDFAASGSINLKLAETLDPDLTANGTTTFQVEAHGPLNDPGLRGRIDFQNGSLALEDVSNGLSQLHGTLEFNQNRLEVQSLTAMSGGGQLSVAGSLAYQHGIYADLTVTGNGIRIRYPEGVSSLANATLRLQGPQNNLLLSGDVLITRFSVSPDLDMAALYAQANEVQTIAPPDAPSNHIRLNVHILSSPQLNFQNAFAKLAGDADLRLRGTVASPSLLGRVSVTEGSATIAGTRYDLQRGEISFTNPVRIEPSIDLNATAHVSDYDITLGLHGTPNKMAVTYRSDPPLPEADVVALLALGRTENSQRIYTQQQEQSGANPTTDALLGGALNATVSSRVQKLFGAGSVKVDPNYLGALGNSTSRIIVEEQVGRSLTLTYATNVNTTQQQLLQAEIAINHHVSLLVARDESGVFSMVVKATRRYR
jgi:translocation and assembly module TamB